VAYALMLSLTTLRGAPGCCCCCCHLTFCRSGGEGGVTRALSCRSTHWICGRILRAHISLCCCCCSCQLTFCRSGINTEQVVRPSHYPAEAPSIFNTVCAHIFLCSFCCCCCCPVHSAGLASVRRRWCAPATALRKHSASCVLTYPFVPAAAAAAAASSPYPEEAPSF
jgi:hypothetical protein